MALEKMPVQEDADDLGTLSEIWVSFDSEGWHNWPEAPKGREYLRHPHRHLFSVVVVVAVGHDNRDIEFHDLKDRAQALFEGDGKLKGAQSCEMMARKLGNQLRQLDQMPVVRVEVSEDGEFGAVIHWGS